jgi:hypothetical protein
MKKNLLLLGVGCIIASGVWAQTTTLTFNPAVVLSGYTQFSNDNENMSFSEEVDCAFCGTSYEVAALHSTTTIYSITSYSFVPGYTYTIQLNGDASPSGNLNGVGGPIYYAFSLGSPSETLYYNLAYGDDPVAGALDAYAGLVVFVPPFPATWTGTTANDLLTEFLATSSLTGTGSFQESTSPGNSTTSASIGVGPNTYNQLNIEVFPLLAAGPTTESIGEDGGVTTINPPYAATTTTLSINKVIITKTPLPSKINGQTYFGFNSTGANSTVYGSGTITGTPGATVTMQVSNSLEPPGTYYTTVTIGENGSGVTFLTNTSSGGSNAIFASNSSNPNTGTFIMPASGSVNWTGYFQSSTAQGNSSINVH